MADIRVEAYRCGAHSIQHIHGTDDPTLRQTDRNIDTKGILMEFTTGKHYHYKVFNKETRQLLIDGRGKHDRAKDVFRTLTEQRNPTQKGQSNLVLIALRQLGADVQFSADEYDTSNEAKVAELESHRKHGIPSPDLRKVFIKEWLEGFELTDELRIVLNILTINQDTVINSYLNKIYEEYPELRKVIENDFA